MQHAERRAVVGLVGATLALAAWSADEPGYRFRAPISIAAPAPFVQLPLPASAYGRSLGGTLNDLRIVDARGEPVPFALLMPRVARMQAIEQQREAALYPLPAGPEADGRWASPLEVTVQGERISVKRLGSAAKGPAISAGWLFDLGERKTEDPPPQSLLLQWSGPAEFTAAFRFDTSDDLRQWRTGGFGQLLALASPGGPLSQPRLMLPAGSGRFVRLVWADAAAAPLLTGAKVIVPVQSSVALDPPTELVLGTSAVPVDKLAADEFTARALHFDLGGTLPLVRIDLQLPPGTRVVPARLQGRNELDEAWRELGGTVFYRLERGAEVSRSAALDLHTRVRYLRLLPDERTPPLDPGLTRMVVHASLASLLFVNQGTAPLSLWAGAAKAVPSALPPTTLLPSIDEERLRFGRATLGEWEELSAAARAAQQQQERAALRPWLLWAVLLGGVAVLGWMVWRLARTVRPS